MELKDVRTGNILTDGVISPLIVSSVIYGSEVVLCKYIQKGESERWFKMHRKTVSPVPLTEEWISILGFEKYKNQFIIESVSGTMYVINEGYKGFYSMGVTLDSDTMYFTWHLKYVHQLQNLYFALTGDELKSK